MFFADVVNSGTIAGIDKMLAFTEARHSMLTENIANIDTPGYKTKQLDGKAFQRELGKAMDRRKETRSERLELRRNRQWQTNRHGEFEIKPTEQPTENVLFHDGTNARIEKQMALLAENAMTHQMMNEMLRGKFDGLRKAIRGTVG